MTIDDIFAVADVDACGGGTGVLATITKCHLIAEFKL